jgi:hypothetical protein
VPVIMIAVAATPDPGPAVAPAGARPADAVTGTDSESFGVRRESFSPGLGGSHGDHRFIMIIG